MTIFHLYYSATAFSTIGRTEKNKTISAFSAPLAVLIVQVNAV
jgi:hypothetical protein